MRKTLLALAAVLLMAGGVSAQKVSGFKAMKAEVGIVERQKGVAMKAEMPGKKKAPKKVQLADNEMIYGNYATDDIATAGIGLPRYPGKLIAATYLPITEGSKFNGATIKSIRFGLCCPVGASRVFIYPYYPDGSVGAALVSQDVETTVAGWNTVELTTPYAIDAKGVEAYFVGFEYTQVNTNNGQYYDDACFPLSFVPAGTAIQSTFVYGNLGQGTGWYDIGAESYGNLSVQCIVEKEGGFPLYDLQLGNMYSVPFVKPGKQLSYTATIFSEGKELPASFTLGVALDGKEVEIIPNANPAFEGGAMSFEGMLDIPADATVGEHNVSLYVKEINGEAVTTGNTVAVPFNVYVESLPRQKQLVEHFTSQYCTYCPLGINVLEKLVTTRNDIAWVSVHGDMSDQQKDMYTITEGGYIAGFQTMGFPSASFNRVLLPGEDALAIGLGFDPSYTDYAVEYLSSIIDYTNEIPALASIKLDAKYDEATRKLDITVSGETLETFTQFVGNNAALTVYLTEDGLVSKQLNQGRWITNFTHDNVLRKVLTHPYGDDIQMNGGKYEKTYSTTLNSTWDKDKMHIVAFISRKPANENLYDKLWVTNTETAAVKDATTTGIENIAGNSADVKEVARYSADGSRLTSPKKGLNIIKFSDGSIVKEIVK
ncbi:Omp28-related outer membrane protein [Palleniella muris]|uniref:Omp28-related outer membrane protein n=1 Tax=Palleniella muris TaxID=3038145 RepID=UPI0014422399|nr:Omp28-related outer membrane protein [Palleniella muris]